jgi:hypothetical protein
LKKNAPKGKAQTTMKAANYLSKTRRDHDLWDAKINDKWGGVQPVLSPEESLLAAKKLYRHAMGKAWPRKWALTSGRRYTWPRSGVFYVNPDRRGFGTRGLRDIIHLMSHWCHRRLHPGDKPHSIRQLRLEARLTKFALDRRWHEGALKKEPTAAAAPVEKSKPDVVVQRYSRMVGRRDKWKRELERAKRLFAKAESEVRAYERRHRERLSA